MRRVVLALVIVIAAFCLLVGCGQRWVVVRQAVPDPFVNRPQFTVEHVHFDQLQVGAKTEGEYEADKSPDQQQSWQADKEAMSEAFAVAVASSGNGLAVTPSTPTASVVRSIVTFIEPGFYVGVAARATEVRMAVQVLDPQGRILDEIAIASVVGASLYNPAAGTRLRQAAEDLGHVTADYLRARVLPK